MSAGSVSASRGLAAVAPLTADRVSVTIVTRNRAASCIRSVERLRELPERPPVIVVDNGSGDRTPERLAALPGVHVVRLPRNLGAAGHTVAASLSDAEYLALGTEDSGWLPGALTRAVAMLDAHPRLAVVVPKMLVGERYQLDPVSRAMAHSPLARDVENPGVPVLNFDARGAVVRRAAFLEVGGFDQRFGERGAERLLAIDLVEAGWHVSYLHDVAAWRRSDATLPVPAAAERVRNELWTEWLRLPAAAAVRNSWTLLRGCPQAVAARALSGALAGLPHVAKRRRPVSAFTVSQLRLVTP